MENTITKENTMQITIGYNSSVYVPAGWRHVTIKAVAEKITEKRVKVIEVLEIDGEEIKNKMSRTGAKRQEYHGTGIALREIGKVKILSKCNIF